MDRIESLIDMEENEEYGGVRWENPEQGESEVNANQVMIDTMKFMVAKLENMSMRIDGLEDSLSRAVPPEGGGTPAVLSNSQLQVQTSLPSHSMPLAPVMTSTPAKSTSEVRVKPSDIKILELDELQRLNSAARLQMFFESVELCASNSDARLEVAKSRVDGDLAVMIHTAQRQGEVKVWEDCKTYLTKEFGVDLNFDQAWRQSDSFHYDWLENPQSFVHKFKCHYAAIRGTFHGEILPDRDKLLKRKLLQGFPKSSKDLLETFMDDNIPLNKFLGHVENERILLMQKHASVNSVPNHPGEDTSRSCSRSNSQSLASIQSDISSPQSENNLSKIAAKLDQLQQQISRSCVSKAPSSPRKFCAFCQTETHSLRDCWRKQERGHCFDCRRYGCRRGNPTCPGKTPRTPSVPQKNDGRTSALPKKSQSVRNTQLTEGTPNVSVGDSTQ